MPQPNCTCLMSGVGLTGALRQHGPRMFGALRQHVMRHKKGGKRFTRLMANGTGALRQHGPRMSSALRQHGMPQNHESGHATQQCLRNRDCQTDDVPDE